MAYLSGVGGSSETRLANGVNVCFGFVGATVSPCPNARSLYGIDEEAAEASALQDVQGVDGGAPW